MAVFSSSGLRAPPHPRLIRRVSLLLGLLVLVTTYTLYFLQPQLINDVEGRLLDARFQFRGEVKQSGLVSIVAVDERSLEAVGRWPWSRNTLAELIAAINRSGAAVIGLDIVFAEPQHNAVVQALGGNEREARKTLVDVAPGADLRSPDDVLAQTIAEAGNVVSGYFFYNSAKRARDIKPPSPDDLALWSAMSAVNAVRAKTESFQVNTALGVKPNVPVITGAALAGGYFNILPGADGIVRSAALVTRYQDQLYPSLAVRTLAALLEDSPVVVFAEDYGVDRISIGGYEIPTDELGGVKINFRGPPRTIPTYSAVDVLRGAIPEGALAGQAVLLGITAIGVYDAHSTSFGPAFPGLEIQATVLDNLALGDPLQRSGLDVLIDLVTVALITALLSLFLPRIRSMTLRFIFGAVVLAACIGANYHLFVEYRLWIGLAYPLLAWLLTFLSILVYIGVAVEHRHSVVRSAFQSYLHPGLVDQLTQNPELLNFGGETKDVSILFSDIRSFTNISEGLTPQQLAQFLNCYMDPMTAAVLNNNGTLDKYIGDAVMAIFGAPYPIEAHPRQACTSALTMLAELDSVKDCCPELAHIFPISIGIGIHSGEVVVGNLGSSYRFAYTALGDNVNLASRLEGLCKQYGVAVVISEATYRQIDDQFDCRELDMVRVKGKLVPIRIFELRGECSADATEQAYLQRWAQALDYFHDRQWDAARTLFSELDAQVPGDKTTGLYLERCAYHATNPPPDDWDGVTVMTSK